MNRTVKLVLAGVLAVPGLVLMLFTSLLLMVLNLPTLALLVSSSTPGGQKCNDTSLEPSSTQAIITGGSSGIGLSIAKECVRSGYACVVLLARGEANLKDAKTMLESISSKTKVIIRSVDVTDAMAVQQVADEIGLNKKNRTLVFCCAGTAICDRFVNSEPSMFESLSSLNYLGSVYTVKAFLPMMTSGTIVFTSSAAGQLGVFGYSLYGPTKCALKGLAEVLAQELHLTDISVQVAFPPDTDTPGYKIENETKPQTTQLISESGGLFHPDDVGRKMLKEASSSSPKFIVWFGFEGWMLAMLTAGMCPSRRVSDALSQVTLMGLLRLVSFFYLESFSDIIEKNEQEASPATTRETPYGTGVLR